MATFRQEQIDDILNYDRAMNRIVLDNEIAQATRFNDERNPPTNRDIKFEALLGSLVDDLKAKMAEALQAIAAKQNPNMDSNAVSVLLGLPTGVEKGEFKNMNQTAIQAAMSQQDNFNYNQALVKKAELAREKELLEPGAQLKKSGVEYEPTGNPPVAPPKNTLTADSAKVEGQVDDIKTGQGRPNKIRKFHLRGGVEPGEGAPPTADGLAVEKSNKAQHNAVENVIYDIVNKYNGIIDKLLQVTQPDGRFASKRTVSASSINYFADVLKGLKEPLTHLIFEFQKIHNPELASMQNMLVQMNAILDNSPPFQKVNVSAYKSGMPDFQGLSNSVQLINVPGYIKDLEAYKAKMKELFIQTINQSSAVLFNIKDDRLKENYMKTLDEKGKQYKRVMSDIDEEIVNVKARAKLTDEFQANAQLIKDAEVIFRDLEDLLVSEGPQRQEIVEASLNPSSDMKITPDESYQDFYDRLRVQKAILKKQLEAAKKEAVRNGWVNPGDNKQYDKLENEYTRKIGELDDDIKTYHDAILHNQNAGDVGRKIPETAKSKERRLLNEREARQRRIEARNVERAEEVKRRADEEAAAAEEVRLEAERKKEKEDRELKSKNAQIKRTLTRRKNIALAEYDEANDAEDFEKLIDKYDLPVDKGLNINQYAPLIKEAIIDKFKYTGSGKPRKGKGGSGGLADLLSTDMQPQYWHHRQLSNDDDIHREVVRENENWQRKSNPVHTTPIGNLIPFYKKDQASMYSFPLKLKNENAKLYPDDTQKDARGADISLLQGPIGQGEEREKRQRGRQPTVTHRTAREATENILRGGMDTGRGVGAGKSLRKLQTFAVDDAIINGSGMEAMMTKKKVYDGGAMEAMMTKKKVYDGGALNTIKHSGAYQKALAAQMKAQNDAIKEREDNRAYYQQQKQQQQQQQQPAVATGTGRKNPKALHKVLFDDEDNDMFEEEEPYHPENGGMIEEESDEEDRFRNKKLGPKKKKSVKK